MPINNLNDIISSYNGRYPVSLHWNSITSVAAFSYSLWTATGQPGAGSVPATGAGAALSSATAGAINLPTLTTGQSLYLFNVALSVFSGSSFMLYDKLVASSGLSGTVTTAQTVNSTALPRYTDGVGVELWLEWYTATGSTAVTATISYTNQAGTSGRSATVAVAASTPANRMLRATLQAGDTGVRSVESFTVVTASTGWTGGAWAVVIAKPLATVKSWQFNNNRVGVDDFLHTGIVKVHSGSSSANTTPCITCVTQASGALTASTNALVLNFLLVHE